MFQVIVFQLFDPTIPGVQGGGKSVNQHQKPADQLVFIVVVDTDQVYLVQRL